MSARKREDIDGAEILIDEQAEVNDQKLRFRLGHTILGFSLAAIFSCAILLSHSVSLESVFMLAVFNLIFVSLIFSLNGSLVKKVLLLSTGNIIGALWALMFSEFVNALVRFGTVFNITYLILYPFVNLMWIVTFFSLSLTALSTKRRVDA